MGNCCSVEQPSAKEDTVPASSRKYVQDGPSQQSPAIIKGNKKQLLVLLQEANARSKATEAELLEEKANYEDWSTKANEHYKQELQKARENIQEAERKLSNEEQKHKQIQAKFAKETSALQRENQQLKQEKESLLSRLSAIAGAKLVDGNADIADLGDENRPTKISEKYSEMYDNEWTEAFDVLTKEKKMPEEKACFTLATAFCMAYDMCKKQANDDLENAIKSLKDLYGKVEIPTETSKQLKDRRKELFKNHIQALIQKYKQETGDLLQNIEKTQSAAVDAFLHKCVEICWIMAIQDPQVFIDTNLQHIGEELETERYKPYTKIGPYIDFIVWPTLYLCQGGGILMKGVAQGTKEKHAADYENVGMYKQRQQESKTGEENITQTVNGHKSPETEGTESPKAVVSSEQKGIDSEKIMTEATHKGKELSDASASMNTSAKSSATTVGEGQTKVQMTGSLPSKGAVTVVSVRK